MRINPYRTLKSLTVPLAMAAALVTNQATAETQLKPPEAAPQSLPATSIPHSTSLANYLDNGGHIFGYQQLPNEESQSVVDRYNDQLRAYTEGLLHKIIEADSIDVKLFEALTHRAPETLFLSHVVVDRKLDASGRGTIHGSVIRDDRSADKILNTLTAWALQAKIIQAGSTFVSDALLNVVGGPQRQLEYKLGDVRTPLDNAVVAFGDCKTSALQRYALLSVLAKQHKINANPNDVFVLFLRSKIPGTVDHAVVGYFDHARQSVMIIDGTGMERDKVNTRELHINEAYLFEDTQSGRAQLKPDQSAEIVSLSNDYFPTHMFTGLGDYSFDLFENNSSPNSSPKLKAPIIDPGSPDPITISSLECPAYTGVLASRGTATSPGCT